jgi:hypothetical protein
MKIIDLGFDVIFNQVMIMLSLSKIMEKSEFIFMRRIDEENGKLTKNFFRPNFGKELT